jgi:hypothetical protein
VFPGVVQWCVHAILSVVKCHQAGVLMPHLGVGFTCGDEECFELFKDIINPNVHGWHLFDPTTQTHNSDLDNSELVFTEEDTVLFAKYVKLTRIRAARHISGFLSARRLEQGGSPR